MNAHIELTPIVDISERATFGDYVCKTAKGMRGINQNNKSVNPVGSTNFVTRRVQAEISIKFILKSVNGRGLSVV